ncbi:Hypothetical protein Minf_0054 [Methylacidiphilum infernorum V4]|uniref:Uncharacterized protein n=1 Tax=Methylacidiphilum infernorum (isolate V4) TaxID=481448 RepID=B3DWX4_METI4|nr:Hypothetical protein Minf_0054 [Methylacidiphilum infernorum V4]
MFIEFLKMSTFLHHRRKLKVDLNFFRPASGMQLVG